MKNRKPVLAIIVFLLTAGAVYGQLTPYGFREETDLLFKSNQPWLWEKDKKKKIESPGPFDFWQGWRRKDCLKILSDSPWVKTGGIGEVQGMWASVLVGTQIEAKGKTFVATIITEPVLRAMVRLKQIDQRMPAEDVEKEMQELMNLLDPDKIQVAISVTDQHLTVARDPFKRWELEHEAVDFGMKDFDKKCFVQKTKDENAEFLRAESAPRPGAFAGCDYYLEFEKSDFISEKDKEFFFVSNLSKRLYLKFKIKDMIVENALYF